jgi:formylglycine-generating enzyme required for sulfatase activity
MRRSFILISIGLLMGCSLYIDDFEVDKEGATGEKTSGAGDPNENPAIGLIDCSVQVSPPKGEALSFCDIDAGRFQMGCDPAKERCADNEMPAHEVAISPFRIQRYEATNAAFRDFVAAKLAWAKGGELSNANCDGSYLKTWSGDAPPGDALDKPVLGVCWYAADAFCKWLGAGYRLPTEAEWERVARGGNDGQDSTSYRIYPFDDLSCAAANYSGCDGGPAKVGSRNSTAFARVYDMGGNAWELVADWYGESYYCDPLDEGYSGPDSCNSGYDWQDPTGPASGAHKVVRGGSWFHDAEWMRNAKREHLEPGFSSNITGFRCARSS